MKRTRGGHDPLVIVSALQKAIRRADVRLAGWAALELFESGYSSWAWRRLTVTGAEDVASFVQAELIALRASCERERRERRGRATRVFIAKAVIVLCRALKSRDPDHLTNLVIDAGLVDDTAVAALIEQAEQDPAPDLPAFVYDVHTSEGRRRGRTRDDFFLTEHAALHPFIPGLFDDFVPK